MSFGERLRSVLPSPDDLAARTRPAPWKIERSGEFAGYAVSGWRYDGLAIWHVKLWPKSNNQPARTYTVAAGEFYPENVTPTERFAVLRLLAMWEADGLR